MAAAASEAAAGDGDRLASLEAQIVQLTASVDALQSVIKALPASPPPKVAAKAAVGNAAPIPLAIDVAKPPVGIVHGGDNRPFTARLLSGDLGCLKNTLFCPAVSMYHAVTIFFLPCVELYALLALETVVFGCLRFICCGVCLRFNDKKFPPSAPSIGAWRGDTDPEHINEQIKWRRAREFFEEQMSEDEKKAGKRVKLFEDGISPRDLAQGQVGDCWLIAAFACAAENPGLIMRTFLTKRLSARGKYSCRLFNMSKNRWEKITVDDHIPIKDDRPLFAQPKGRELWVAILEKAFAKFVGSYERLDGGFRLWAFSVLTGDPVYRLEKEEQESGAVWSRLDMSVEVDAEGKRSFFFRKSANPADSKQDEDAFFLIRKYCKARALLGASFGGYEKGSGGEGGDEEKGLNGETFGPQGLVSGHAYSVLDACSFKDPAGGKGRLNLIQLRNPWGSTEWTGAWSDSAPEWDKYPRIRRMIRPEVADDGKFWMSWTDFSRLFSSIDVCSRSTGVLDLHLDVMESDGCAENCLGPTRGCTYGCATYWCACRSCAALYCNTVGAAEIPSVPMHERDDTVGAVFSQTMARAGLGEGLQII